jgi:hypothetical protein
MKSTLRLLIIIFVLGSASVNIYAQGCVAVRNMSTCSLSFDSTSQTKWQVALNYRYFKSFRHFTGQHEDKERVEENTNVINHDNSILIGTTYTVNKRWAVGVTVPVVYIDRSSRPRDANNNRVDERHYVTSKGIGDVRLMGYYSAIQHAQKLNLILAAGVKLPTGNYNFKDEAYVNGVFVNRPVDQSIQPGDGGTGLILEADLMKEVFTNATWYTSAMYLLNPRNTNGTLTNRSNPYEAVMSVPDQFFVRTGVRYMIQDFQFGVGGRLEGIPVRDVVGKSDGFRRPGYIVSAEPSISYMMDKHTFGVNVPIALHRNRTQSVADKRLQADEPSKPQHGDAAFADWLLSVSYSYKF